MESWILSAFAGMAIAVPCVAAPVDDRRAIERIEHEIGAVSDAARFKDFYATDAVLYDGMLPGVYRGLPAIQQAFAAQLKGVKTVSTEFIELAVDTEANLAIARSLQRIAVSMDDGSGRKIVCRATDVYRRAGGRWRIAHQHISYPVDPTTGAANFAFEPSP